MTFVANPIAAPKRTHMAMPDHLAELATRVAPVRPMTKVRPPVVDMKAIEEGNRIKQVAARIEVRDAIDEWRRKQEEKRHQLWMLEQRRRAKLGLDLDYYRHPERPNRLLGLLSQFTKVSVAEMKAHGRKADIVRIRAIAIWLVRRNCKGNNKGFDELSLPRIGRLFGGRDHSTILHAIRKVDSTKELNETALQLERMVLEAERKLYGGFDDGRT